MSTALVKASSMKIEVVDPSQFADAESALFLVCEGQLTVADLADEYFADDDTQSDLEGIAAQVPRISANAQSGVFCEPGTPKADLKKCPDELVGIILARRQQAVHYVPKSKKADLAREVGYDLLASEDSKTKWICHNGNCSTPSAASLNPQLSQAEREEAFRVGLGGATGTGCLGCPAGQWRTIEVNGIGKNFRPCSQVEALIFVDSKNPEARVLQVSAGNSVGDLRKFISARFMRGGKPLSLFTYMVRLGWRSESIEGEDVLILAPSILGAIAPGKMQALRKARADLMWMLEKASGFPAEPVLEEPPMPHADLVGPDVDVESMI